MSNLSIKAFSNEAIARGYRLKLVRKYKELTTQNLANAMGYHRGNISSHESGRRPLKNEQLLEKICWTTGVNIKWLCHGTGMAFNDPEINQDFSRKFSVTSTSQYPIYNEGIFLDLYNAIIELLKSSNKPVDMGIILTTKAYSHLSENSTNIEELRKNIPSTAKLAASLA